jgi:hypothetical protein
MFKGFNKAENRLLSTVVFGLVRKLGRAKVKDRGNLSNLTQVVGQNEQVNNELDGNAHSPE